MHYYCFHSYMAYSSPAQSMDSSLMPHEYLSAQPVVQLILDSSSDEDKNGSDIESVGGCPIPDLLIDHIQNEAFDVTHLPDVAKGWIEDGTLRNRRVSRKG